MRNNILISRSAHARDAGLLAAADVMSQPGLPDSESYRQARKEFWLDFMGHEIDGQKVAWSELPEITDVRIARNNGMPRAAGYLALGLTGSEHPGFVRPGLHIVVCEGLIETEEVREKLYVLGSQLCPEVVELGGGEIVAASSIAEPSTEPGMAPAVA